MRPGVSAPLLESPLGHPPAPRFADVLATLPVAVLVIDAQGRIAYANAAAEELINLSERAMLGQPLASVLVPPVERAADGEGRDVAAFDAVVRLIRGGSVRVDYAEAVMRDHPGWRTVTLNGAGASRRAAARGERASARAAVGAAQMLAHEIKNPLSGIRGAAQLIGDGVPEQRDLTSLITSEVDRIAALIDRMQDFTDTRPLKPTAQNIYPLLDHAVRVARAGFARAIAITDEFDPSLPAVLVDGDAMLQVLLNLIKNAAEAVQNMADPCITLSTAYRHGMSIDAGPDRPKRPLPIEICIVDNGPGAPPELVDHLFDPFVTTKPEGQGLGLALADKLVRDMGGLIQYERDAGRGLTILRLRLPRGRS